MALARTIPKKWDGKSVNISIDAANRVLEFLDREGRGLVLALAQGAGNIFHHHVQGIQRR